MAHKNHENLEFCLYICRLAANPLHSSNGTLIDCGNYQPYVTNETKRGCGIFYVAYIIKNSI